MAPFDDFPSSRLPYTLQTFLGMVKYDGQPQQRHVPASWCDNEDTPEPLSHEDLQRGWRCADLSIDKFRSLFTTYLLEDTRPGRRSLVNEDNETRRASTTLQRLRGNIKACHNYEVDATFMKRYMHTQKRIDLEQAAAIVISAIKNDPKMNRDDRATMVKALLQGLEDDLIGKSCMWLELLDEPGLSGEESMFKAFAEKLEYLLARKQIFVDAPKDWRSLVVLLLRIRRYAPVDRCLWIPPHMFDSAKLTQPADYLKWRDDGRIGQGVHPSAPRTPDSIVISRKMFRAVQRRVNAYFKFWVPEVRLHRAIGQLQDEVLYPVSAVLSTADGVEDTMLIAHYFFAFQRRLQLKVVSDINWTRFLAKGEGKTLLQNSPNTMTLFEEDLSNFAGQSGVPIGEQDVTALIDKCCLLMEEYVQAFGDGKKENLTFKQGQSAGSGRGPVDQYNMLCDILRRLRDEAEKKDLPAPGPVHKFLAKDILYWNNSWADDAFANGKVPGWEVWLMERRSAGAVPGDISNLVTDRARQ